MQICICRVRVKEWIKISDLLFFQEGPGVRNTQYTQSGVKLLNVANLVNGKVDLSTSDRYISKMKLMVGINIFYVMMEIL